MSEVGQKEKLTQQRVVKFFRNTLRYAYLGNWDERGGENVEEPLLRAWLLKRGYDAKLVDASKRTCIVRNLKLEAGEIFSIEEKDLTSCDK